MSGPPGLPRPNGPTKPGPVQSVTLLDRLTGCRVQPSDGQLLLGRHMVPPLEQQLLLGSRRAAAGDYLVGRGRHWSLHADQHVWWSGDFGHRPCPDPLAMDNVLQISETVAEALAGPLEELISTPPLVMDTDRRLRPHPLEERIRADLGFLRTVCGAPHARLRTDHTLVPVSRARGVTWRTVVHLSAHSETWAARRLRGVEPAQLLTPVRIPDCDLYENRVVAALVDRLWQHVLNRSAELDSIVQMVERGQHLLDEAESRPGWRSRQRLYSMIGELLDKQRFDEDIHRLRKQLDALRGALAPQLESRLRKGVRTPYDGRPKLNSTNLFVNDVNYRRCRDLWNAWVRLRGTGEAHGDPQDMMAAWCCGFARFALLLVVQALEVLGLQIEPEAVAADLLPGGAGLLYQHRAGTVRLVQEHDDTLTMSVGKRVVLRIVPLPHALTASGDPDVISAWLSDLDVPEGVRLAVIYPGEPLERSGLPAPVRLAVHQVHGGRLRERRLPALIPVSPSDIDSVARVGRLLRSALDGPILAGYPVRIPCRASLVAPVAEQLDWIEPGPSELVAVLPPTVEELSAVPSLIGHLRHSTSRARQQGDNQREIDGLVQALRDAATTVQGLLPCPVCNRHPARNDRGFQRRDDTYRCVCDCGTVWGTRRCQACGDAYAVLITPHTDNERGGDGDHLDRVFAQDLLATPCWRQADSFICPACGSCSEIRRDPKGVDCARCAVE